MAFAISGSQVTLYSGTAVTADATGTAYCFPFTRAEDIQFTLDATYNSGSSTLDVKLQDSDVSTSSSTHWSDLPSTSFTQVTTSSVHRRVTPPCGTVILKCVRAIIDVGASGSPNYDVVVKAFFKVK